MRAAILAFVFGVWWLQQQAALPAPGWFAMALLIPVPFFLRRHAVLLRPAALAVAMLVGVLWAALFAQIKLADQLPGTWENRDIQVVGVVASLPQMSERSERFLFDVERIETEDAAVPQRISIARYVAGFRESRPQQAGRHFRPGERWRLTLRLKRPHGTYNPHGFDFEAWALERNIRATGYIRPHTENARLDALVIRPAYLLERVRETVRKRFLRVLGNTPATGVLLALTIGDDDAIPDADWETFRQTGTIHLMSISGLHVTMLAGLGFALVNLLWRRSERLTLWLPAKKAAALAGLLVAFGYAALAGFAVPTQRTVYMLAVLAAALWWGRSIPGSLALCWALVVVVMIDPWAVIAPGFWLSFGAVALLMFAGSNRAGRPGWFREAIRAQWVVTLGLVPLLLALFQQVSLVSPVANAFAIPVVSFVVTPLALLGALLPIDALLHLAHGVMDACMHLLQTWSALPWVVWERSAPPVWAIIAGVAGLLWCLLPRGFPLRWIGTAGVAPLFLLTPAAPVAGELQVAALDVGQGTAVVLRTAHHTLMYDTGPKYSETSDSGNRILIPYLRGEGIRRLDGLMVSHDDLDHTGGAASLLKGVPIGWMIAPFPREHALRPLAARNLLCIAGQDWTWDGVRFEVLHPTPESYADDRRKDNDRSCVLKVTSAYGSVLLTGDIERISESELLARGDSKLKSDILLVPHHGSRTSSMPAFVEQVHPAAAVFTVGYLNRFGHPKKDIVARYQGIGSRMYRSDRDGTIIFDFREASAIEAGSWRRMAPRYWHESLVGVDENSPAG